MIINFNISHWPAGNLNLSVFPVMFHSCYNALKYNRCTCTYLHVWTNKYINVWRARQGFAMQVIYCCSLLRNKICNYRNICITSSPTSSYVKIMCLPYLFIFFASGSFSENNHNHILPSPILNLLFIGILIGNNHCIYLSMSVFLVILSRLLTLQKLNPPKKLPDIRYIYTSRDWQWSLTVSYRNKLKRWFRADIRANFLSM